MALAQEALQAAALILHPQQNHEALLPLYDNQYFLNPNKPQINSADKAQAIARIMLNAEYLHLLLEEYGQADLKIDKDNQPISLVLSLYDAFGSRQIYEEVFNFSQGEAVADWKE